MKCDWGVDLTHGGKSSMTLIFVFSSCERSERVKLCRPALVAQ